MRDRLLNRPRSPLLPGVPTHLLCDGPGARAPPFQGRCLLHEQADAQTARAKYKAMTVEAYEFTTTTLSRSGQQVH